jgi:phage shock protein PspC (stress-responsive transcriptional regulator)
METDTMNPAATQRGALRRPYSGRMLTGVAAGIGDYLGVDPMIVRIAFAVLVLIGGAGIPLYLAGLLLIPDEGSDQSIASELIQSIKAR